MGEISEMILEGILCQVCGGYCENSNGIPQTCSDCKPKKKRKKKKKAKL